ncbi:lysozyme [Xanthomonas graminis]|uniref:lysozyme n=1 Tax=Xanthomonas graminis TaxID=3390026 RepID=UPI000AAC94B6|nr:lysozyme [Xanthomonas translucens]
MKRGQTISAAQAEAWLVSDLEAAQRIVRKYVRVRLTMSQEAALVSFVFNVGWARFSGSTLVRLLNKGDYACVPAQLARWNKARSRASLLCCPAWSPAAPPKVLCGVQDEAPRPQLRRRADGGAGTRLRPVRPAKASLLILLQLLHGHPQCGHAGDAYGID